MARCIANINLVFTIAVIFGIGTCSGRLHDLLWPKVEATIVVGIRHGQAGYRGMPVDASPAEVDVFRIVAHDERRRIGGIIGRCKILLLA